MKPIVICTSPRTGSNLLLYSLAAHPQAICGGEWFNNIEIQNFDYVLVNKQVRPEACNLYKLFGYDSTNEKFEEAVAGRVLVYLYRRDRSAQLTSWRTACETGVWMQGYGPIDPIEFPANANELIDHADNVFRDRANLAVAYEDLLTPEGWNEQIERVEQLAGWDLIPLEKATRKITPAAPS